MRRSENHCQRPRYKLGCALAAVALITVGACADDLGKCDPQAASEVVYSSQGLAATKGQALVHDSCGQGVFCHSAAATRAARYGAPAGMNFDTLPSPLGWPNIIDRRDAIWKAVRNGTMPPGSIGQRKLGHTVWTVDIGLSKQAPQLPEMSTTAGKAVLRNWLACGAPIVAATRVPSWAQPSVLDGDGGASGPPDWSEIFNDVVKPSCATSGCHDVSSSGHLSMVDECSAYNHLLEPGLCGVKRLIPGDSSSLLVSKLSASKPSCGGVMPPTGLLPSAVVNQIAAWVETGAPAMHCGAP